MNRIMIIPFAAFLALIFSTQITAQEKNTDMKKKMEKTETHMMDSKSKVENKMDKANEMADNKPVNSVCIVSGEEVDNDITAEYNGKTYAFCCKRCLKKFNNDPEKYINKYEETKKSEMKDHKEMKNHMDMKKEN